MSASSLRHRLLHSRPLALGLLSVSLLCNLAALILPFMTLRQGLNNETYTLFHSIRMLWNQGLYALSLLVVGFSIFFPFAKLGSLFWLGSRSSLSPFQQNWLRRVEALGKWSMLDAFLVAIVLSLASRQFLVNAAPEPGLALFIAAILLSMTAGELVARQRGLDSKPARPSPKRSGGFLLALSGLTLAAALAFPFLKIEDWLLADRQYSILTLVPALWIQNAWIAALLVTAFLVATPALAWIASFLAWRRGDSADAHSSAAALARRWSMLDVFGLALLVFTLESDQLMSAEIDYGALFLGATLLLQMLLFRFLGMRIGQNGDSTPEA